MTVLAVILWCNLLQVKPQYLDTILEALKPHILPSHLVISIAAGIRVASLEAALPEGTRVASISIPYCSPNAWIVTDGVV
jgi:pyrroline-5-carboxylate reductase